MRFLQQRKETSFKMLNAEQERVIKQLAKIEKGLINGASLTFAVDNLAETMSKAEWSEFVKTIHVLIAGEYLARHTDKETPNRVPFWLEFTRQGRRAASA